MRFTENRVGSAAFLSSEEYDKAISDAEEAITKNKEFAKGYFRKAAAMRQQDKIEEAMALLKAAPQKVQEDESIKKLLVELAQDYKDDHFLAPGKPNSLKLHRSP